MQNMIIKVGDFRLGKVEKKVINQVLDKGRLSEGYYVKEFEEQFANFIGCKYAVAISSGTAALICGLTALKIMKNIKDNNKAITTPLTYIATSNAIVLSGFEPVYVDIEDDGFNINAKNIRAKLESDEDTSRYSLILPVHLMGYPCDIDKINEVASEFALTALEDSAQAHGTLYKGRMTGSFTLMSFFSFYVAHNIQAGEMGAVVTDSLEVAKLIRKIKTHGRLCDCPICQRSQGRCPRVSDDKNDLDPRFRHDLIGYNFKTMEFQAALGVVQLKKVKTILRKRQENVSYLNKHLVKYSKILRLPRFSNKISYLAYPIIIKDNNILDRRKLCYELENLGIETRPLFGCIPTQQPAYSFLKQQYQGKLPNAEYIGKNGFYIGCHQYLGKKDLDYIIKTFDKILMHL